MPVIDLPSQVYQWTPQRIESVLGLACRYDMMGTTQESLDCFIRSGDLKTDLVDRFMGLIQVATDTRPSTAAAAAAAAAIPATDISSSSGGGDAPAAAAASPPSGHIRVRLISVYVTPKGKPRGLHVGVLVEFAGVTAPGKTDHRCWIVDRTHAQFGLKSDKFPAAGTKEHRLWAAVLAKPESKPAVLSGDDRPAALTAWRSFLQAQYGVTRVVLENVGETLASVGAS